MTDDEIDTSEIQELTETFFENAKLRMPLGKSSVVVSVDNDVLEWFQRQGSDFGRLVNNALRDYAETHR